MWIDLFVDRDQPRRLSATLYDQIRDAIATGRLAGGDRLPTSRQLATELGVARSTITTVYGRLTAEGVLQARIGDGTYVAGRAASAGGPGHDSGVSTALAPRRRVTGPAGGDPPRTDLTGRVEIDLRTGRPDPNLFPLTAWRRCVTTALQVPPPGYGEPGGLPALRQAVATWVARSRGVMASPQEVLITAGAQQVFDLLARVLAAPGEVIAVEEPGYPPARRAFEHHGLRLHPVTVDRDGIVVDDIPAEARAVYVTPSHQSPTGVTMSAARRKALLALATRHDQAVIEDDYDTEYRYVDRPLEPIQRLDTAGRVVYVGTFSKILSPSLRLGFVVGPEPLIEELGDVRALCDTEPPHLTQAALAALIGEGHLDRHLRRARRIYAARHRLVTEHANRLCAEGLIPHVLRSNAGLHTMIGLPDHCAPSDLAARLARNGIAIDVAADCWLSGRPDPVIAIGFGQADLDHLAAGLQQLRAELVAAAASTP